MEGYGDKTEKEIILSELGKICYTGEGRGKFSTYNENYQFGYESILDLPTQVWAFGFNLPIYGEEILKIHLKDSLKGQTYLSGTFGNRVKASAASNPESNKALDDFFTRAGFLLKIGSLIKNKSEQVVCEPREENFLDLYEVGGKCRVDNIKRNFFWGVKQGYFELGAMINKDQVFVMGGKDNLKGSYRKFSARIKDLRVYVFEGNPFQFEMYVDKCSSNQSI